MNENEWATAIRVFAKLLGQEHNAAEDPDVSVQRLTQNVTLAGFPRVLFSKNSPRAVSASTDFEAASHSVEDLYGCYDPAKREIELFMDRIQADRKRFSSSESSLLTIVRMHEHAHAIVHLGVFAGDVESVLGTLDQAGITDWPQFFATRDNAFAAIDDKTHELLAQAITWAAVSLRREDRELAETFLALQEHQSEKYRFDPSIKLGAISADWPLVLKAARCETDVYRDEPFELLKGVSALLTPRSENDAPTSAEPSLMRFVAQLQEAFANVDLVKPTKAAGPNDLMELLLARKGHIQLRMHKEAAHERPHFHIEYKKEYAASYALDTFELLAGFMPRRYEDVMLPIAREMRNELANSWQALNGRVRVAVNAPSHY